MSKVEIIKRPVEKLGGDIRKSAWSAAFESFVILVLGILCIVWPDMIVKLIAYIVGTFFVVKGGIAIINYFAEKGPSDILNNKLLSGVVCVLIGIAAFVIGQDVAHVFSVIIGIIIIYESLVRINSAIKLRAANVDSWVQIAITGLIMMIVGVFVTFGAGGVVPLVGWMMVLTGIIGIVGDVIFMQHVNMVVDKLTGKSK